MLLLSSQVFDIAPSMMLEQKFLDSKTSGFDIEPKKRGQHEVSRSMALPPSKAAPITSLASSSRSIDKHSDSDISRQNGSARSLSNRSRSLDKHAVKKSMLPQIDKAHQGRFGSNSVRTKETKPRIDRKTHQKLFDEQL